MLNPVPKNPSLSTPQVENPSFGSGQEEEEEGSGQWVVVGAPQVQSRLPPSTGFNSLVGVTAEASSSVGAETGQVTTAVLETVAGEPHWGVQFEQQQVSIAIHTACQCLQ